MFHDPKQRPVIVVDESDARTFEATCKTLLDEGYRMKACSVGFVQSEKYDFCASNMAIFLYESADSSGKE